MRAPQPATAASNSPGSPQWTAVHSSPPPSQRRTPATSGGRGRGFGEAQGHVAVRFLDGVERRAQRDPAVADHRDVVGDPLHLLQQVRREEHRAAFMGDGAHDGFQDVAAHHGIEAGRRLVEQEELGTVGQRDEQSGARLLPPGEVLDPRRRVQGERSPQLLRVGIVPGGIEGARVANELAHAHPAGEIVLLGEIADPRQDADRVGDGIESEDAHRAALRSQQAQEVLDERRLARSIRTDEAVDRPTRQGQAHRVEGGRAPESSRQLRYADDRLTHPRTLECMRTASGYSDRRF